MATQPTLLQTYQKMADEARLANVQRQQAVESIFDKVIAMYGPGGSFGQGAEAELATQKVQDIGKTSQRDIGRGLYGIRPYEQEWEKTVGAPSRLKLEDIKMERLSGAQMGKASFLENIQNPYPDYGPLLAAYGSGGGDGGSRVIPSSQGFLPSGGKPYQSLESRMQSSFPQYGDWGGGGSGQTPSSYTPTASVGQSTGTTATPYNADTQKQIYADLLAGERAGTKARTGGSLEQSVFADKPPTWGGNYQIWKQQMDAYNKSKGLSLSGY